MDVLVASGTLGNFFQLLISIFIFVAVLAATWFVTKWIGSYQKEQLNNKNIQVLETMRLANNRYIQIVRIAEVYLVLAVCKDSIVTLTRLSPEDVEKLQSVESTEKQSYKEIFEKMLNKNKKE